VFAAYGQTPCTLTHYLRKLATFKCSGELPIDAFMRVSSGVNNDEYEDNPILLDMPHARKFAGNNDT
jgi:hypothetical protein